MASPCPAEVYVATCAFQRFLQTGQLLPNVPTAWRTEIAEYDNERPGRAKSGRVGQKKLPEISRFAEGDLLCFSLVNPSCVESQSAIVRRSQCFVLPRRHVWSIECAIEVLPHGPHRSPSRDGEVKTDEDRSSYI